MSHIILAGSTYSGTPASGTLWQPVKIEEKLAKVGTLVVSADGTRRFVFRAHKREWTISWERVPNTTRDAVIALRALTTTFTFTDEHGTSYTVQTEEDDHQSETALTDSAGTLFYDVSLTLHEV